VSFLPENRFLLATNLLSDLSKDAIPGKHGYFPVLVVYDLDQASTSQHDDISSPIAIFSLEGQVRVASQMILYYPSNIHSYSDEVAVPFFRSPSDELIALQTDDTWDSDDGTLTHILLIPIVRLTSYIAGAAAGDVPMCYIPWSEWGAIGTRWTTGPYELSLFRGSLSGSRFIPNPKQPRKFVNVGVWDFSRARVRVAQLEPPRKSDRGFVCCEKTYQLLPSVQTDVLLPTPLVGHAHIAISEDALIFQARSINPHRIARLIVSPCDAISAITSPRHISSFFEFYCIFELVQDRLVESRKPVPAELLARPRCDSDPHEAMRQGTGDIITRWLVTHRPSPR
jgi:hypothetical protein